MKQRGFTLIELLVGLVIFGCFVMLIVGVSGTVNGYNNISSGINGMTESRCIEGYKFIINQVGRMTQI